MKARQVIGLSALVATALGFVFVFFFGINHTEKSHSGEEKHIFKNEGLTANGSALNLPHSAGSQRGDSVEARMVPATPQIVENSTRDGHWSKYPGTLDSQIQTALSERNGRMAFDVAQLLNECELTSLILSVDVRSDGDAAVAAQRAKRLNEYQRIVSRCQTVVGDRAEWQAKLLSVAVEKNIFGAAAESFSLGARSKPVVDGLLRDAYAGDLRSVFWLAALGSDRTNLPPEQQAVMRDVLILGSRDPAIAAVVKPKLKSADLVSRGTGGTGIDRLSQDADSIRAANNIVNQIKTRSNIGA